MDPEGGALIFPRAPPACHAFTYLAKYLNMWMCRCRIRCGCAKTMYANDFGFLWHDHGIDICVSTTVGLVAIKLFLYISSVSKCWMLSLHFSQLRMRLIQWEMYFFSDTSPSQTDKYTKPYTAYTHCFSIFHCRVTLQWVSQKPLCLEHWSVAVKGLGQRHAFGRDVRRCGWNASLCVTNTLPWGRGWLDHWCPEWWSAFNCMDRHHLLTNVICW